FDADDSQFYKPSVDITFTEAARFCPGKVLGVVLTGMGADGCQGARELKRGGSMIWAQDEASSVIYGMPGAVAKAGLTDQVLGLDDIGTAIGRLRS
ncbi:MAG: chemotaxis protein CheB, partial [Ectothiorhodospiraceae bacterium]